MGSSFRLRLSGMLHGGCAVITSLAVQRFFRTPKGLLLIVLVALTVLAAPFEGIQLVWPGLFSSLVAASLIDAVILRLKRNAWEFPSGAILTALLVAMVLSPRVPWYLSLIHI